MNLLPILAWVALGATPQPTLIGTDSLARMLESEPVTVLDVRQPWTAYLQNHLPGAVWLNVETLRSTSGGLPFQLLPADMYATLFSRAGVRADRPVVVYSAGDQMDIDATFVVWILAGFQQPRIYLLDGGMPSGFRGKEAHQEYLHGEIAGKPPDPHRFAADRCARDVQLLVESERAWSMRARERTAEARRAAAIGSHPGSRQSPLKEDLEQRELALVWKPVDSLRADYVARGITQDQDIILYCNSSTEASHVFFTLKYLLGYPKVRIYTGAWSEWAERMDLPIE